MLRKVYIKGDEQQLHAYLRWQGNDIALFGLKEGYKKGADNLVSIALAEGAKGDTASLDTFIYPIVSLYTQAIEISLKQIHLRFFDELPKRNDNLSVMWDDVEQQIIKTINSTEFIQMVMENKKRFILYSLDNINFESIHNLISEMQNLYYKTGMWQYYIGKNGVSYFTENEYINYVELRELAKEIYDVLEYILFIATTPSEELA